jgi:hypothetical protein
MLFIRGRGGGWTEGGGGAVAAGGWGRGRGIVETRLGSNADGIVGGAPTGGDEGIMGGGVILRGSTESKSASSSRAASDFFRPLNANATRYFRCSPRLK